MYAIEWLKQKAIQDTESSMQGHLLDDILQQQYTEEKSYVVEQATKLQYDMSDEQVVIYFQFQHQHTQLDHQMIGDLSHRNYSPRSLNADIFLLLKTRLDSILSFTPAGKKRFKKRSGIAVKRSAGALGLIFSPCIRLSLVSEEPMTQISLFAKAAKEAQYARLLPLLKTDESIIHYQKLGLYGMLLEMNEAGMGNL
ncbi:hypothetical protein ACEQPO_04500 [Bacillus sp. SL00103]